MENPKNLKYTKTEEWVQVEGNVATIGITYYAQDQLSDIVYIEYLFEADDEVEADAAFATLESVKAASDVMTPVAGTVLEINEGLADTPEEINQTPYSAWMVKIEMSDASPIDGLMDADAYEKFAEEREH
jgi:glycine cleavage system H protein